jgi:predicted secreted protein
MNEYYRKRIDERDLKDSLDSSRKALDALQKIGLGLPYHSCEESWTQVGLHCAINDAIYHVEELMTLIEEVRNNDN